VTTTTTVDDHRVDDSGHGGDGSGSGSGSGSDGSRGLDDRRGSGGSSAGTTGATLEHQTLEGHGARVEDAARLAPGGTSLGE
jgi:hypothetical protein